MSNQNLFKNKNLGVNLDFSELKDELITLFKSPNPFHIYMNSQNIKDKFSEILSVLTLKLKEWFKIDSENEHTFIMTLYKQTNYDKVWLEVIESYLRDCKNFDVLNYVYFVKILNKEKQYLAKWLLKLYKKNSQEDIIKFLQKYNTKLSFSYIKNIFDTFHIWEMSFDINLREDFIEHFIEKIYLQLSEEKRDIFLDNFILKIDKNTSDFSDVSKIISKIISSYTSNDKYNEVLSIVWMEYFQDVKLCVDDLILKYGTIRSTFYLQINDIITTLNQTDRSTFWKYVKRRMIDTYYSEVKNIFYESSSNVFLDKQTFSLLSGEFRIIPSISPESEYIKEEYKQINDLKEIILEMSDNIFSFFLLPIIYYTISEKLSLRKKDLHKMKYLLLFIFSKNYSEYKKIYMFFNQLEIFLNYDNTFRVFEKIQISFSIILILALFLLLSYFYFPIWVFVWVFILAGIKYFEVMHPNIFYRTKWNIGIKFFATVFLCVSTYFWFTNFDKVKNDTINLTKQIEVLWTLSSKEVIDGWFYYIKANILEFNKKQ